MGIKIASFNVKNLSDGQGRDLDRIASLVRQFDVVAMQEVLAEGQILQGINIKDVQGRARAYERSLKRRLGEHWDMCWGDPKVKAKKSPYLGDDKRGEGYAFLWNTRKVEIPEGRNGQKAYPVIWTNYKTIEEEGQMRLLREPFYGRFRVKNCYAEIRLITTHIMYGKPKMGNQALDLELGAVAMRQNEFHILAGQIYEKISNYHKLERDMPSYTFILGDYNLNLPSSGLQTSLMPEVACFDEKGRTVNIGSADVHNMIHTVQSECTSLKSDSPEYANNYDHFSYDDRSGRVVRNVYRVNAIDGTEKDFDDYRQHVSDHVPVAIELDFRG